MPILSNPLDLLFPDVFLELRDIVSQCKLHLKLDGYNVAGSIKIKPAIFMTADLERRGLLKPNNSTIIESSSGNLGVALALICSLRRYSFICIADPNISAMNRRSIEAYGGRVVIVDRKDKNGGYLESRLAAVHQLLKQNPDYIWLNQYANPENVRAHSEWTAMEILNAVPQVTHLYVGTGTTGTIMGLAKRFAELSPHTAIIAVEPEGSSTFDPDRKGRRLIPGIGTSRKPELADASALDRIVYVSELEAIGMCQHLARRHGLLLGGSTGSVLAAVAADADRFGPGDTIVAVSPDLGDKYLETIFSPEWVEACYGASPCPAGDGGPPYEPLDAVIGRHAPSHIDLSPSVVMNAVSTEPASGSQGALDA